MLSPKDLLGNITREIYVLVAATLIQDIQITTIHTDCLLQVEVFKMSYMGVIRQFLPSVLRNLHLYFSNLCLTVFDQRRGDRGKL